MVVAATVGAAAKASYNAPLFCVGLGCWRTFLSFARSFERPNDPAVGLTELLVLVLTERLAPLPAPLLLLRQLLSLVLLLLVLST